MKFSKKVLAVRLELNMSQSSLAKKLKVAFVTINRWKNGRAEPKALTKHRLDEFCRAHKIQFGN